MADLEQENQSIDREEGLELSPPLIILTGNVETGKTPVAGELAARFGGAAQFSAKTLHRLEDIFGLASGNLGFLPEDSSEGSLEDLREALAKRVKAQKIPPMFLLGATGTGKTEAAKQFSDLMTEVSFEDKLKKLEKWVEEKNLKISTRGMEILLTEFRNSGDADTSITLPAMKDRTKRVATNELLVRTKEDMRAKRSVRNRDRIRKLPRLKLK